MLGVPCSSSMPPVDQIVAGPDGNLWFTMTRSNAIGQMKTAGAHGRSIRSTLRIAEPEGLTVGPDGRLWFTEAECNGIGAIDTGGTDRSIEYLPTASSGPSDIAAGPTGRCGSPESLQHRSGGSRPRASITTEFAVPTTSSEPSGITNTGAGLWFTESGVGQIAQITTAGRHHRVRRGRRPALGDRSGPGRRPLVHRVRSRSNAIGRITTGGIITNHFPVPTPGAEPSDITLGPDKNLWFTEFLANKIGRVVTAPPVVLPPPPPVVSLKPKPKRKCKVPKVRGLTIKKAVKKLKKARCKYKVRG